MANARTTVCGAISAAAGAVAAVPGIPPGVHTICLAVAAVALALLGFFSQDANHPNTITIKKLPLTVLAASVLLIAGCTLSQFHGAVSSPTWGSAELTIGGGTIGNATQVTTRTRASSGSHKISTNSPAVIITNTQPIAATNT